MSSKNRRATTPPAPANDDSPYFANPPDEDDEGTHEHDDGSPDVGGDEDVTDEPSEARLPDSQSSQRRGRGAPFRSNKQLPGRSPSIPPLPSDEAQDESSSSNGQSDLRALRASLMGDVKESEVIKGKLRIRQKKKTTNGQTIMSSVAELGIRGDEDWRTRAINELAGKGPAEYIGIFYSNDGRPINEDEPLAIDVTEEIARDHGWKAPEPRVEQSSVPVVASKERELDKALSSEDPIKDAKVRIELTKLEIEQSKLAAELRRVSAADATAEATPTTTTKTATPEISPDMLRRLEEAERAKAAAERREAELKAKHEREAAVAELKAKHDRELADLKLQSETDKRAAERLVNELREDIKAKQSEHQKSMEALQGTMERRFAELATRAAEPPRKVEDTVAAIANAFAPLLKPVLEIVTSRPAAPDPMKQMEAMAGVFEKMIPKQPAPKKEIDPLDLTAKVTEMAKNLIPAPQQGVTADQVAAIVAKELGGKNNKPQDPMTFTKEIFEMARGFAEMQHGPSRGRDDDDDDDRDRELPEPKDPLDVLLENKEKFEKLGMRVTNSDGKEIGPPPPPPNTLAKDVIGGIKDLIQPIGGVLLQYAAGQEAKEELAKLKLANLKERQAKRVSSAKAVQGQQTQAPAVRPQQPRAPQPQQQPQFRPQQPQAPVQQQAQQFRPQPPQAQQRPPQQFRPQPPQGRPQVPQAPRPPQAPQAPRQPTPPGAGVVGVVNDGKTPYNVPVATVPAPRPVVKTEGPSEEIPQRGEPKKAPVYAETMPTRQEQAAGVPPGEPPPFREEVSNGVPSFETWGHLAKLLIKAIDSNENPEDTAIVLLERFKFSSGEVLMLAKSQGLPYLDQALTALAHAGGPYASVVGEFASRVRSENGAAWITRLIAVMSAAS